MKQYKVTREIQKSYSFTGKGVRQTTEKGTLKTFATKEEAIEYLAMLHRKATQLGKFRNVTNGASQFRAYTADKVYIYKVV